jgi:DNA-binding response OmpR family regulator
MNDEVQVLIVDDDEINADMLSKRLQKRGFVVHIVLSGQAALEFIEHKKPKIILLDILMPDMTGIEVLNRIRQKYSALELSIIMVTAKSEVADIVDALKCGANDYIQKPVNIEIAVARITTQLKALSVHDIEMEKKEAEALKTMIATFNHEINNPLTVAFGFLWKLKKEPIAEHALKVEEALNRVVDIVKKIEKLTTVKREKDAYAQEEKIYKV